MRVVGGSSRQRLGRGAGPADAAALDLSAFAGVVEYEPGELVLTAGAATPLAEVEALLARHGQALAFEPPDHAALCGEPGARPTLGGTLAANAAGPRRVTAGAARDHFLGFEAVSGRGDAFRAGGRVVKNVTGFDLPKLMAGSFGTLAVLTTVTVKVSPRPEASATLIVGGLPLAPAVHLLGRGLGAPSAPDAAAFLPDAPARRAGLAGAAALFRLEGAAAALPARIDRLVAALAEPAGALLEGADSEALWTAIGAVGALLPGPDPLWRTPLLGGSAAAACEGLDPETLMLDWGGALLWSRGTEPPRPPGGEKARLWSGESPHGLEPQLSSAEQTLSARVRAAFDPAGILNRGRLFPPQIETGL